jgi:phage I-like protein
MQYVNYEEAIVQRYSIELLGWTYKKFVNPSELSTAVEPLCKLLDAIKSGDCKFIKLTAEECRKHLETYRAKIAAGEIKACERKTQSDTGTKKRKEKAMKGDSSDDGDDGDLEEGDDSDLNHHSHKGRLSTKH